MLVFGPGGFLGVMREDFLGTWCYNVTENMHWSYVQAHNVRNRIFYR